ncbi:probable G-protein coupled receptor 139 [Narcine bancroftii]|uniref:probable G-protein coupled receptor 139 n=1 Tax=Narcine bancroftii TaxID=1343680 RepID=UPI003831813B
MFETINSVKKIYFMILAIIGVPVNLVAIVILSRSKCGLSTCTTCYLVAMAVADLLTIITAVILWRIVDYYFIRNFLDITPVCSALYALSCAATDCSVWFTVTFTFDRFVAICCQKLKANYCTGKTAIIILGTITILICVKNVPFYFTLEPWVTIDNVPRGCKDKKNIFLEPGWMGFEWFDAILCPLLPFGLILLLNALTVRYILAVSRVRKGLRNQNRRDPETESRRRSVILLFTLSGSFILLWMVYVTDFLYYIIAGIDPINYTPSKYVSEEVGFILLNLSCCTNTFIYAKTQSKFREQFKTAVKYPVNSIIRLMNK